MILLHGRGSTPESILGFARALARPHIACVAPAASGSSWYPHSFLSPLARNEPHLSSALRLVRSTIEEIVRDGVPPERIVLLGFSQGACLALEFVARNPARYGAVAGLTGGLIGPEVTSRDLVGDLRGTPVFLGTSDPDPHVPRTRVEQTADLLQRLGAQVTLRIYPGMPHTVNDEEIDFVGRMLDEL